MTARRPAAMAPHRGGGVVPEGAGSASLSSMRCAQDSPTSRFSNLLKIGSNRGRHPLFWDFLFEVHST